MSWLTALACSLILLIGSALYEKSSAHAFLNVTQVIKPNIMLPNIPNINSILTYKEPGGLTHYFQRKRPVLFQVKVKGGEISYSWS
jgi:hypothetical protein